MDKKVKDAFKAINFTDEDINKLESYSELKMYSNEVIVCNLMINFRYLLDKLYDEPCPEKIIKKFIYFPKLLCTSKDKLEKNWQNLKDISISDNNTSLNINNNDNFLHFTEIEVRKIVEERPDILCTETNNIINRITKLKEIGYTKENIIYMTISAPAILMQPYEGIKNKISYLADLKYNKSEILAISSKFPTIFNYSFEALDNRFFLLENLKLHDVVVERPFILKQSPKLTYARYMFFLENNISIETNNRKLFLQEKLFSKIYNITKEELFQKYDYNVFEEEKAKILVHKKEQKKY